MLRNYVSPSFLVLMALAVVFTALAYAKSPELVREGIASAWGIFWYIIPNLIAGLILGGMVQVLLPKDLVVAWSGEGSGFKGLALATILGAITPGGPFVQFPVVASLWKAGTAVGPVTAYITAWALLGFQRILVWEAPILGWHFALTRVSVGLVVPILMGGAMGWLYRRLPEFLIPP